MSQVARAGRRRQIALAGLVVVIMLWSGNAIVGRAVRDDIPPFFLALVRWTGALALLLPFAARHLVRDRAALLASWKIVLLLGLTGVASFNALIYTGLHYTTASNSMLLQAAIPPLVLLADRIMFGARSRPAQVVGVIAAMVGVVVIVCQGSIAHLLDLRFGIGDIYILVAVVAWALYTSLLRLRPGVHPLSFLAVTFAIAALTMLPLAFTERAQVATMHWTPLVIGGCLYVAIFPSLIAYLLYNRAVAEVGPGVAGQAISLMPLFGAGLAALLLAEPLHGYHAAGMALIAIGLGIGWLGVKRAP
ncbi:DMT family transporter [Sphingomonas turrisvirgatae]|uniref:Permease n=1 Tax=Sphingomonas turrisvirgatae TaxID=1888892 RepID=A0A1E3LRM7_9SPHN|nr:DMT family transporter [Sphingomonas turrisvirgatae]ODP36406.1 permease [Sphingomonas turrisvirgatae]